MMYLCQFGQNLVIDLECRPGFFTKLYDPGDLENWVKVTKSNHLLNSSE